MKVKDILEVKGSRVINCHEDNSVMDALAIFAANKVGSLLVVDSHEKVLGILAPRDALIVVLNDYDNWLLTHFAVTPYSFLSAASTMIAYFVLN